VTHLALVETLYHAWQGGLLESEYGRRELIDQIDRALAEVRAADAGLLARMPPTDLEPEERLRLIMELQDQAAGAASDEQHLVQMRNAMRSAVEANKLAGNAVEVPQYIAGGWMPMVKCNLPDGSRFALRFDCCDCPTGRHIHFYRQVGEDLEVRMVRHLA